MDLILKNPHAKFDLKVPRGYQESELLKSLVTVSELEPKAENCTKVTLNNSKMDLYKEVSTTW